MSTVNNSIRAAVFIQQLKAGRHEQVAAMIVEAMMPYGKLPEDWPGRNKRNVAKLSRHVAKNINPKRGKSEAELLSMLKGTFGFYASYSVPESVAQRTWLAYLKWTSEPDAKINDLLAEVGIRYEAS